MVIMNKMSQKKLRLGWIIVVVLMVIVAVMVVLNRAWIYDWARGVSYRPSGEMAAIRDKLQLTWAGEFLFNAVQPELNEAEKFNENCRNDESEIAVLGCYTVGNIYIYNIDAAELKGIRELTAAHELLHAKWARMSDDEKVALVEPLTRAFDVNQFLADEISQYDVGEKQEELYVRAGTEVKDLPAALEKHYAEIFKDQDAVVDFYNSYITVFREIKAQMEELANEMEMLKAEIDGKTANYEAELAALEVDIANFNSCAETAGCFNSEWEFYAKRNMLMARENNLNVLNNEINNLIDIYNVKVNEYNANVLEGRKLQNMINSKAEDIEIR